ncbi:methyltransferase FkbM family [Chloroherpeton thalassium ATCC 35110]|uniref:Methyltransferase FkbM family n=1 Tax=Chloroherpeton thalassium (strain ATCC 35110 / GB-78) TaxID=517418 RepID=B3QXP9_CHLT3|nr:FkbM family methyltransferase [Chloroherpeton thalassium]ACF14964.1 methyltransferase FkbM family [Chloroherpeton thalassium ATCC 35110]
MNLAPIVLFVYNRPWHTEQTLIALTNNELCEESVLYIYADGAKVNANSEELQKIEEVRKIIRQDWRCRDVEIIQSDVNKGLANSIIQGVTDIVNRYGKVIVLEDDIVTSIGFLKYMNDALVLYENEEKVMHISGYMFPVKKKLPDTFFYNTASCWGWGTWKRAWKNFNDDAVYLYNKLIEHDLLYKFNIEGGYDFERQLIDNIEGNIKTWAIKWYASFFLNGGYALHPYPSLTNNIGHDNSGQHCGNDSFYYWSKLANNIKVYKIDIQESKKARKAIRSFYKKKTHQNTFNFIKKNLKKHIPVFIIDKFKKHLTRSGRDFLSKEKKLNEVRCIPRFLVGSTDILGKKLTYVDSASFCFIYKEVFETGIYNFNAESDTPYIIDAGANIGLGVIFFKSIYPNAKIIAFEPDEKVFEILNYNIEAFGLQDVHLVKKGLWDQETILKFYSEGADAGRIAIEEDKGDIIEIPVISLRPYLNQEVDLLKIDIEGAEYVVLKECEDLLKNVKNIFIEYHSFIGKEQNLAEIIFILKNSGFRYNINTPGLVSQNPFTQINTYNGMDMQLNIYAFRTY